MTGMAGEKLHPVNNGSERNQPIILSGITMLELTVCITKYILFIANNIMSECKNIKRQQYGNFLTR
ncbi:hypothetical protein SDC9_116129 [bioreactor metagenome]|uniref:Uncharacterized protein n=1 Tax=bioreactor metagenome TaxID=1076179 RepID=A0A645BVB8_9ZZZZ